jgi:hypothetical protein
VKTAPARLAGLPGPGAEDAAVQVSDATHGPRPVNPPEANFMTLVITKVRHPTLPGARARL